MISTPLNPLRPALQLIIWFVMENVPCALQKNVYSVVAVGCSVLDVTFLDVTFFKKKCKF